MAAAAAASEGPAAAVAGAVEVLQWAVAVLTESGLWRGQKQQTLGWDWLSRDTDIDRSGGGLKAGVCWPGQASFGWCI